MAENFRLQMLNFELHRSVHCWNEINVLHIYVTWHKQKWNISSVLVCSTFSMFWTTSTWWGLAWHQSSIDVLKVWVQFMDLPKSNKFNLKQYKISLETLSLQLLSNNVLMFNYFYFQELDYAILLKAILTWWINSWIDYFP